MNTICVLPLNILKTAIKNKTLLSTKILLPAQKELVLNSGLGLVSYDAIRIEFKEFELPTHFKTIQNIIITSKNAWQALKNKRPDEFKSVIATKRFFCVGDKVKNAIEESGGNVLETAENAFSLAEKIIQNHKKDKFLFFCGNLRRDELPNQLSKYHVSFHEQIVYQTLPNHQKFNRTFDGILFASPSAVQSYCKVNEIGKSIAFCIGTTTTNEAKKYTDNIVIATKPSIENMIVQAIKTFIKS